MPDAKDWRSLVSDPVTRYQVRPIPAVLIVGIVTWLIVEALVDGHWLAGLIALVVAVAWAYAWLTLRRRRLQRALVLPPSARSERRAALKEERAEAEVEPEEPEEPEEDPVSD